MPELNKANRQVCDVDIRVLKTMAPFLFFDTANTTTAGISGDSVYARANGVNRIPFPNPIQGTMSIEAQVYPFRLFALFSDGIVRSETTYAVHTTIKCTTAGQLKMTPSDGTIVAGSVFAYPVGGFGDEDKMIKGAFASNTFTATTSSEIAADTSYEVGFLVTRTSGVQVISIDNDKVPKDLYITQSTLEKDEEGALVPFLMTAYHAYVQRNFELSFASDGDPASISMNFDLLEDKNGKFFDMVEITTELTFSAT